MKITVLGSGSAFHPSRAPSGILVGLSARNLIFDLGFGNLRAVTRAGVEPASISDVFFSHRHPDHCGDLAALLFHFRYHPRATLRIWGPKGFAEFVTRLQAAFDPWCHPKDYALEVRELRGSESIYEDGWSVETLPVPHPTPALAYRLSYKGKTLVYSGDTGYSPALADFAADADLFLLECASSEKEAYEGHLTPRLALATLEASRCKRGLLTHLSAGALVELRARRLRAPLARDGQTVRL